MPRNNMPENWQPPAPAWQGQWPDSDDPMLVAYFGIQSDSPDHLAAWGERVFALADAPASLERARYSDSQGRQHYLFVAYWRRSVYVRWWQQPMVQGWWQSSQRIEDGIALWREVLTLPFDHFETLNSSQTPHGVSVTAAELQGPIEEHGYAGGMRDRIAISDQQPLRNEGEISDKLSSQQFDNGKRVWVTPPTHCCVIRSGQNWGHCDAVQKAFYLQNVAPVLKQGMQYLQDNPKDSRCYSMRFATSLDPQWQPNQQSFGLGYAMDIHDFEQWAKSHPSHLAILEQFMAMVQEYGEDLLLKLWHEVLVIAPEGAEFEYINCPPETGLLRYT